LQGGNRSQHTVFVQFFLLGGGEGAGARILGPDGTQEPAKQDESAKAFASMPIKKWNTYDEKE
jgi:hypothetical protein